jgi:GAG-pre-integrase domain
MGNGSGLSIFNIGSCCIGTTSKPLYLHNLLHVPDITKNLLSISQLTKDNAVIIEFTHSSCFVKDRLTHQTLLHGTMVNGLYQLDLSPLKHEALQVVHSSATLWHSRLAHCSPAITSVLNNNNQISVSNSKVSLCSSCCKAKAHKLHPSTSAATVPLEVVHTDLWGPAPVVSNTGNKYYVLFTDEFSRFSWIYYCSCKSNVPRLFSLFKSRVENLLSHKIKMVQCDGGTEFKPLMQQYPEIVFQVFLSIHA